MDYLELEKPSKTFDFLRILLILAGTVASFFSVLGYGEIFPRYSLLIFLGFWGNTFFYFLAKKKISQQKVLWSSLLIDLLLIDILIETTGGRESPFIFLYPLLIFVAGFHLGRRGADTFTFISLLSYSFIYWHPERPPLNPQTILQFFVPLGAMGLSGLLALRYVEERERTRKKIAETHQALFRAEELHRLILQSLASGLIVTDLSKKIISANQAAKAILQRNDLEGLSLKEAFDGFDFVPESSRCELLLKKNGQPIYIGYSFFPLKDEKKEIFGYSLIFQDITPIKEKEERLRRAEHLAALGTLASGLAHEIKNPLASICGAVEFLKEQDLVKPGGERLFEIIAREAQRLDVLVSDFLLFAKPTAGAPEKTNLLKIIGEIQDELALKFKEKDIHWEIDIPPGINLRVDAGRFKQILLNLCSNAIEAYDGREATVRLVCQEQDDHLEIKVIDYVGGISQEIAPRIFEPFFTTKPHGTGLGLAVVYSLVKGLKGQINVKSSASETCFSLSFPKEILFKS
ncbi:two-component system sensor histidine kinase NtrB [Thermodesulfatator atlanticus]|uniref:two-component system sensor histidine kinase NtrB n=1 Tax=Thermodesulfatator atlanticus TaxID=501497 RepID=UPI0003B31CDA|nr:ATP-binding protein [Thermodesulfatator atlanticus]